MDFDSILNFLVGMWPWAKVALEILGALVVIGTVVDKKIPDEKDGGFMSKLMAIPLVGGLLAAIAKFSPFNVRE